EIYEGFDGTRDFPSSFTDGLAIIQSNKLGQLFCVLFNDFGELQQGLGTLVRSKSSPWSMFECLARGRDRIVDIGLLAFGCRPKNLFIRRIYSFKSFAGFCRQPFRPDE